MVKMAKDIQKFTAFRLCVVKTTNLFVYYGKMIPRHVRVGVKQDDPLEIFYCLCVIVFLFYPQGCG